MSVLPDTSVWVEYLRHGDAGRAASLGQLLDQGQIVACGPVAAELLAGLPSERRPEMWQLLTALPWAGLRRLQWRLVGDTSAKLRAWGKTVPLTDIEIAVAALGADAALWSRDGDFDRITDALPGLRRFAPSPG